MGGVIWRPPSSLDEIVAMLDALNQTAEQRRATSRAQLEAVVARLDAPLAGIPAEAEPRLTGNERPERTRRVTAAQDPEPFVPLPRRNGSGGWGPKLTEMFREAAREKGGW
jgi:hypothetical protein